MERVSEAKPSLSAASGNGILSIDFNALTNEALQRAISRLKAGRLDLPCLGCNAAPTPSLFCESCAP